MSGTVLGTGELRDTPKVLAGGLQLKREGQMTRHTCSLMVLRCSNALDTWVQDEDRECFAKGRGIGRIDFIEEVTYREPISAFIFLK